MWQHLLFHGAKQWQKSKLLACFSVSIIAFFIFGCRGSLVLLNYYYVRSHNDNDHWGPQLLLPCYDYYQSVSHMFGMWRKVVD